MKKRNIAMQLRSVTMSALLLSATFSLAQRNQNDHKLHVEILATTVVSVDQANNSFTVRYHDVNTVIKLQSNFSFTSGGARSTAETFFRIATGKNYYINVCDSQPVALTDMIWDGVSFASYKKDAEGFSGTVKQQIRDVVRVEQFVYKITDKTNIYVDDRPGNKQGIRMGQWSAVTGEKGKVTPEAAVIKVWKVKPSNFSYKINEDEKREIQTGKDKLKDGVRSVDPPGLNKGGKKITNKSGKSGYAAGNNGKTQKVGGR